MISRIKAKKTQTQSSGLPSGGLHPSCLSFPERSSQPSPAFITGVPPMGGDARLPRKQLGSPSCPEGLWVAERRQGVYVPMASEALDTDFSLWARSAFRGCDTRGQASFASKVQTWSQFLSSISILNVFYVLK